jgi:BirA family biotin operon repressor/biotin-[acetyl-CoA-carboxylase] ligase
MPDRVDGAALVRDGIVAMAEVLAEAASTMDRSRQLAADESCPLPAIVVADRQTLGRGRRGARWWLPPGSLAMSIVVDGAAGRPIGSPRPTWSLACGVAVAEAIRHLEPGIEAVVRWPNDVEVGGRKLAGILVETAANGRAIFGIGVNTCGSGLDAAAGLRGRLVTIPDLIGRPLSRQRLVVDLVPRLLDILEAIDGEPASLGDRYRPLCSLTGSFVRIYTDGDTRGGICRGITAAGELVLETEHGRATFRSGSLTPPGGEWRGDG